MAPTEPWDLPLVLSYLQSEVFEPLESVDLRFLTCKTTLLLALASARRVSELRALSCSAPFLIFHDDRAELRTHAGFLPKVVSAFHLNQPIVVPVLSGEFSSLESTCLGHKHFANQIICLYDTMRQNADGRHQNNPSIDGSGGLYVRLT